MRTDSSPPARYASLFRNGRNQAVRIPREFEMGGDRVRISKDGDRLILEPIGQKPGLLAVLADMEPLDEDFPDIDEQLRPLDDPKL